jgi:WD40 repeat protein
MQPVQHLGPVCALKILSENLILSGNGPTLTIHDYTTGEKLFERTIFNRNKIHGIEILNINSSTKIAVWGGRSLSIFTLESLQDLNIELPHFGVGDWIFHCLFENENKFHILNSHNIVHTVSLNDNIFKLIDSRNCGWKSILYSGTLHLNKETNKITVLAGTVMNGILIWDYESCKVKYNLTQHEGSIFNVISSPDGKYIISCSDDRSIKVWNLESGELLANGWGHGSRIWGLNVYNVVDDGFNIFSCSEDCTARIWTFKKDNNELKQERIILNHTGRHVWSCAVNDGKKLGFTGGADGKIVVTDLNETKRIGYFGHKWELKDIGHECNYEFKKGELIKEYVDFGFGLLAVTSEGKVMILKNYNSWTPLFIDPRFERFCVLKGYKNQPICVLGNKLGDVILMKFNEACELVIKKEISLHDSFSRLGNILVHEYNNLCFALFESPNLNDSLLYKEIDSETLDVKSSVSLTKPADKISISSIEYDSIKSYLLVGCRFATLLVYQINKVDNEYQPLTIYKNLFKGDTISSLKSLRNSTDCIFYLTNRDGTYHIMKINSDLTYEFLQTSRIQKGFLEGILELPNGDVLLYGFKSDSFFVWNETKQYEVMREICGGPHRRWFFKYWFNKTNDVLQYRFIYTRASEVQIIQKGESNPVEVLSTGLHGREVRDICVIDAKNTNEKIVITGAEDTTLKIATLKKNGELELHWTYREHVAGLQSIHAINNEYIMSSSAREELFIWKINECNGKKCMNLDASLPPGEENPDLRIMDFDSIEIFNEHDESIGFLLVSVYSNSVIKVVYYEYSSKNFKILIDDSYLQCCIFHVKFLCLANKLYILIGSTNGHVTIYDINSTINKSFDIIAHVNAKIKLRKFVDNIEESRSKLDKLIVNQQLHQSSIKALEMVQITSNIVKLITGGDDNALIVSKIERKEGNNLIIQTECFDPSAASSTITTISVINKNTVLVGAVDQSVKLWNFEDELKVIEDMYTTIADTGCSEITRFESNETYALIGGAGFSIWKI